jgi:hypothetical protein
MTTQIHQIHELLSEKMELREIVATAICVSRGLDPTTLHQTFDEAFDFQDDHARKYICAWRKHVPQAIAAITAIQAFLHTEQEIAA